MTGFLQGVIFAGTELLLLLVMAAVLGKLPVHLFYKINVAIAGVSLTAALFLGHRFSIVLHSVTFTASVAALVAWPYAARRRARRAAGGQTS